MNSEKESNKLYLLVDVDYGMYEGEKDNVKINYISANKDKFLEHVSPYSTNSFNDMTIYIIDEKDFDKSIDISLSYNHDGISIKQFLKENNYEVPVKKNKIK